MPVFTRIGHYLQLTRVFGSQRRRRRRNKLRGDTRYVKLA